jgi:hypothetical protein
MNENLVFSGGIWSHAKPLRDTSWWHRRKRERSCPGHEWHPENSMVIDWFCCKCGKETDNPRRSS